MILPTQLIQNSPIKRNQVLSLIQAGIITQEYRFSRRSAESWLSFYPGDLTAKFLYAKAYALDGYTEKAIPLLKQISILDAEYLDAQELLAEITKEPVSLASVVSLGGELSPNSSIPGWGTLLYKATKALESDKRSAAETYIQNALLAESASPLPAILHLKLAKKYYQWKANRNLASMYIETWPDSIAIGIIMADLLMDSGDEKRALGILNQCMNNDINGQVALRMWGESHPFSSLWPTDLSAKIEVQIPAAVSRYFGWNQLSNGNPPTQNKAIPQLGSKKTMDKSLESIKAEIVKIAQRIHHSQLEKQDGRSPVYVIITSRNALEKKYGSGNVLKIEKELTNVVENKSTPAGWSAILIFVDDLKSTSPLGLTPAKASDPWEIKNLLRDLDDSLANLGQMIAALLIVGGPDIVPFHLLPNPVEDLDNDVPSDNPYATPDEDYFVPAWPVGRIPDGTTKDPKYLLNNLTRIANSETVPFRRVSFLQRIFGFFRRLVSRDISRNKNFGYTAEIWQRASHSVFRPIGSPKMLAISPPTLAEKLSKRSQKSLNLAYYNLHGLIDAAEWYGQRDPIETPEGIDYPIALRPQDILNSGRAPHIVFTEACYGAHISGKNIEEALSLKFLSSGTKAVIGATNTSYGSISTPLIAADLLGQSFWKFLKEGYPVGEALRRGKIYLAREMHKRQGYLDGEDQKTLIQFILLGDPLTYLNQNSKSPKSLLRPIRLGIIPKTVCDKSNLEEIPSTEIPSDVIKQVKSVVKNYLPGMAGAKVIFSQEHEGEKCTGHLCPSSQIGAKSRPTKKPGRRVVTLSKTISTSTKNHPQYARLTLNEENQVVKVAVSR